MNKAIFKPAFFIFIFIQTPISAQVSMLYNSIDTWAALNDSTLINLFAPTLTPSNSLKINSSFYRDFFLRESQNSQVHFELNHKRLGWSTHYLFSGQNIWNHHELINCFNFRISSRLAFKIGVHQEHSRILETSIPYQHHFSSFISTQFQLLNFRIALGFMELEGMMQSSSHGGHFLQIEYPLQNSQIHLFYSTRRQNTALYLGYSFNVNKVISSSSKINLIHFQFQQEVLWTINPNLYIGLNYRFQSRLQSGITLKCMLIIK